MADTTALKNRIRAAIKANDNQEITGPVLQQTLLDIVDELSDRIIDEYAFIGIAVPTTIPPSNLTEYSRVFYLTAQNGVYTNLGGIEVSNEITAIKYNGTSWFKDTIVAIDNEPTAGSDNLVKSGGVQNEIALGAVYNVSAKNPTAGPNNDGKWESLSALLSDANISTLIPTSVRKGGMSIKFIQSVDNKYVQYLMLLPGFNLAQFTNVSNWQGVDNVPTANSNNLVKSGGVAEELVLGTVYDVSAHNSGATFASLNELLSSATINTLIPTSVRRGGMTIKFIQSVDNKYVQYRMMLSGFDITQFTNVANWQGVDNAPIANSNNLVKSSGVYKELYGLTIIPNYGSDKDTEISVSAFQKCYFAVKNNSSTNLGFNVSLLDSNKNVVCSVTGIPVSQKSTYRGLLIPPSDASYIRISSRADYDVTLYVSTDETFTKTSIDSEMLTKSVLSEKVTQNTNTLTTIYFKVKAGSQLLVVFDNPNNINGGTIISAYDNTNTIVYTTTVAERAAARTIYVLSIASDVEYFTFSAPYIENIKITLSTGYAVDGLLGYVDKQFSLLNINLENKLFNTGTSGYATFGNATKVVTDASNFTFTTVNSGSNNGITCTTDYKPSVTEQIFVRMKIKSTADCVLTLDIYSNGNVATTFTDEKIKVGANEEKYITIASNAILPLLANQKVCLQFVSDGSVVTTITISELVVTNNIHKLSYYNDNKILNYDSHIFEVSRRGTNCHFNSIYEALCFIKNKDTNIATNTDLYTIHIHEGVYEDEPSISIAVGLQSKYFTFGAAISFIGDDPASCIVRNTITASNQCHIFDIAGSACVKNLTIEVLKSDGLVESDLTRGCYCVHVDRDWNKTGEYYITEVSDCVLYNEVGPCIGAGLRDNQRQRYLNNVMTCAANMVLQGANIAPLYAHAPAIDGTEHNAKLDVIDNTLIQNDDADYAISMGDVIPEYPYTIIPCYFKDNVVYAASGNEIAGQEYFKTTHLLVPYCFGNNVSELNY